MEKMNTGYSMICLNYIYEVIFFCFLEIKQFHKIKKLYNKNTLVLITKSAINKNKKSQSLNFLTLN